MKNQKIVKEKSLTEEEAKASFENWRANKFILASEVITDSFQGVEHSTLHFFTLKTLIEKRYEENVTEPYSGSFEPEHTYTDLSSIPIKDEKEYQSRSWFSVKEKSEEIKKCGSCKGKGKVKCQHCNGKGRIKDHYTDAKGKRRVQYIDCDPCMGTGKVECSSCKGYGKIISYIKGNIIWQPSEIKQFVSEPPLPRELLGLTEPDVLKELENVSEASFKELPEEIQQTASNMWNKASEIKENEKLIRSTLTPSVYYLNKITYLYKDKSYSLLYYGLNTPFVTTYPKNYKLIGWMSLVGIEGVFLLGIMIFYLDKM